MPPKRDVLRFHGTLDGLSEAADALQGLLDERELDEKARYNVQLAFEEIAANIVRHGFPTTDVEVSIDFDRDEIILTFEDDGVPFDPRERPDPPVPASLAEAPIGGLGLVLVRKITTRMAYERTPQHRNLLTLTIPARGNA
jgi:anti-sigma regulatory factor (Ser/Thr protein kinase)